MPGSKALSHRDWLFGSRPRRLLIESTLRPRPPREGWTKSDLARLADVSPHGGVDEHVAGLARLDLLIAKEGRWLPADATFPLARALTQVTKHLAAVPDGARGSPLCSPVGDPASGALREVRRALNAVERANGLERDARQLALAALAEAERALAPAPPAAD